MKERDDFGCLTGSLSRKKDLWCADIVYTSPNGKETTISSGYIFESEDEAKHSLDINLNMILDKVQNQLGLSTEMLISDGTMLQ